MVGTELTFFAGKSHFLAEEYINATDVIAFCGYLTNKMRRNFIKISGVDVGSMRGRFGGGSKIKMTNKIKKSRDKIIMEEQEDVGK